MAQPHDAPVPPGYQLAVHRWGPPVGVEKARTTRWGELLRAVSEEDTVTLLTLDRSGPGWAALAPLREVPGPVARLASLPTWSLGDARPRLGSLVRAAADYRNPVPQILTRYRRPVAALIAVHTLVLRPAAGDRIAPEALLQAGGQIELSHRAEAPGRLSPDGDGEPPQPAVYVATARDADGTAVGSGEGESLANALHNLTSSAGPSDDGFGYSDEPPF